MSDAGGEPRGRALRIVAEALDVPDGAREAFIAAACGADAAIQEEVRRLLNLRDIAGTFLERPLFMDSAAREPLSGLCEGTVIGRYTIRRLVGSGAMADVYEAVQAESGLRVALKLLKPGAVTRESVRRFRAEVRSLAKLSHPGIAVIHDADVYPTPEGARPFFAMELVDGETLSCFVRERELSDRERVELMVEVCRAVEHAHQRGIIHRDLKPANILVRAEADGGAGVQGRTRHRPVVLDFGLARTMKSEGEAGAGESRAGAHTTAHSVTGVAGSLPYMSPEQARGCTDEADTRSDVYSLGVILYELLTGRGPHAAVEGDVIKVLLAIAQEDHVPLRAVRADLDAGLAMIVDHALERDPDHRYQSAGVFADDLTRWLAGEDPTIGATSTWRQTRRLARRHPAIVTGAAVGIAMLVAGLAVTTYEARRASRAELLAEKRLIETRRAATELVTKVFEKLWAINSPTDARLFLAGEAIDRLEAMVREGSADPGTLWALSTACQRAGEASGHSGQPNAGDRKTAVRLCDKAMELRELVLASDPGNPEYVRGTARLAWSLSIITDDAARREALVRRAISLLSDWTLKHPHDYDAAGELAYAWNIECERLWESGRDGREALGKAVDLYERLAAAQPARREWTSSLAIVLSNAGAAMERTDPEGALANFRRAREILTDAYAAEPENYSLVRHIARADRAEALAKVRSGAVPEGRRVADSVVAMLRPWYEQDRSNSFMRLDFAEALVTAADVRLADPRDVAGARALASEAMSVALASRRREDLLPEELRAVSQAEVAAARAEGTLGLSR